MVRKATAALLAALAALLAAGVTIAITVGGGEHTKTVTISKQPAKPVTVTLGGPGKPKVVLPVAAQKIEQSQQADAAVGNPQDAEANLHAEPAAASAPAVVQQNRAVAPPGQPVSPQNVPAASPSSAGCRTLHVRNFSSRAGSPSLLIVLHQTISPDNGWSGVLGNVRWFDSAAAQASSNYIVSRAGGQCAYIVPESLKAWAQAGFNRVVPCSVEVTETGHEGSYLVGAGRAKVVSLVRGCAKRWHIPLQHGKVSGCSVVRPGVVEHADLGSCGGGHFDDNPYSIDDVIAAARGSSSSVPGGLHRPRTATERRECAALQFHRRKAHAARSWKVTSHAAALREKRDLAKRKVYCPSPYLSGG
jgi:hypothetical protein